MVDLPREQQIRCKIIKKVSDRQIFSEKVSNCNKKRGSKELRTSFFRYFRFQISTDLQLAVVTVILNS
jgi:hypothetical protein